MINSAAIGAFLSRLTDSWDWIKSYGHPELDQALGELNPPPDFQVSLWQHQKACFLLLTELKRFCLHIGMGGGKALPLDEPVLTPCGEVSIGDLRVGDFVIGASGYPTKITGVYPQGVREIFEVRFSDRTTVRCTEDHLWAVTTPARKYRGASNRIKPLRELMGNLRDPTSNWRKWFIPVNGPVHFQPGGSLELHPYALGVWLGDGCRLSPSITSADPEIPIRVAAHMPPDFRLVETFNSKNSKQYNFVRAFGSKKKNDLCVALQSLEVFNKYSWERFIPQKYLMASIDNRIAILNGLMDTDGYIATNGTCYFSSSSRRLAEDFAFLVRSLGGVATLSDHTKNRHRGCSDVYFSLPVGTAPCLLGRKLARYNNASKSRKGPTKAFEAITRIGASECVCISVEAQDGLFLTKDFTVTHNTLLTLMLLKYRKQCGEKPKAIVFVPYLTAVDTWVEEVKKHSPDLRVVALLGDTKANLAALHTAGDLFVICYQSAVAMVSEAVPGPHGKTKWQLSANQVRKYFAGFDMLVMDEIHKCSNVNSLTYRMCRAISAQCEYVLGLTGTPFGKTLESLWPQFYLIDFGETLGPTLGFYRGVFFTPKPNYWGGLDYQFKRRMMPTLIRIIKHRSIHYSIDEFADMPPKQYISRTLPPPPDSAGYCQVALKAIREAHKGKGSYQLIESNYLKLRQLSSGFLTLKGEDNAKLQIKFQHSPKMDEFVGLVDSMDPGSKCVCFHHFVYTNSLISDKLRELKIGHARIWGGQRDQIGQLRKFRTDPDCRVLVINVKSGSSSLNLQFANYIVFFEMPDSPIDRQQAEARVWRPGQAKRVMIYDFLVRGTVDHQLQAANLAGANLLQELLEGKVQL